MDTLENLLMLTYNDSGLRGWKRRFYRHYCVHSDRAQSEQIAKVTRLLAA